MSILINFLRKISDDIKKKRNQQKWISTLKWQASKKKKIVVCLFIILPRVHNKKNRKDKRENFILKWT